MGSVVWDYLMILFSSENKYSLLKQSNLFVVWICFLNKRPTNCVSSVMEKLVMI